jgi:hypothetical protein
MLPIIFHLVLLLPTLALALVDGDAGGEVGTLDRHTLAEIKEQQRAAVVKVDYGECCDASMQLSRSTQLSHDTAWRQLAADAPPGMLWRIDCLESSELCVDLQEVFEQFDVRFDQPGYLLLGDVKGWTFAETRRLTVEELRVLVRAWFSAARLQSTTETSVSDELGEDLLWTFVASVAICWAYLRAMWFRPAGFVGHVVSLSPVVVYQRGEVCDHRGAGALCSLC